MGSSAGQVVIVVTDWREKWRKEWIEHSATTYAEWRKMREARGGEPLVSFTSPKPKENPSSQVMNDWTNLNQELMVTPAPEEAGEVEFIESRRGVLLCTFCINPTEKAFCGHLSSAFQQRCDAKILRYVNERRPDSLDNWYLWIPVVPSNRVYVMVQLEKAAFFDVDENPVYAAHMILPCDRLGKMYVDLVDGGKVELARGGTPEPSHWPPDWFQPGRVCLFYPSEGRRGIREAIQQKFLDLAEDPPFAFWKCMSPTHNQIAQYRLEWNLKAFSQGHSLHKFMEAWCSFWFDTCWTCWKNIVEVVDSPPPFMGDE